MSRPDLPPDSKHRTVEPIRAGVFDAITESLKKRWGFRHLWLGDSGMGKTIANEALIEWLLKGRKSKVDLMISIDDKNRWEAQYAGAYRIHPEHLRREPLKKDEPQNHVVFRGIAYQDKNGFAPFEEVSHEEVAAMTWELVRLKPVTVCMNIDELADATNGNQAWTAPTMRHSYRKGRAVGISVIATTQLPQQLPRESFGLSDSIGIFRLTSREAEYLKSYRVITNEDVERIANLGVGEWMLVRKSHPPDPNTYKLVV